MLNSEELINEQRKTLDTPRLKYDLPAWVLFRLMDSIYGKKATLSKFLVLEIVARMPYVAWEQVSYVAITHVHSSPKFAKKIHGEVLDARQQQDNELWHLLIIEELVQKLGKRKHSFMKMRVIPQILAYFYYHISWLLYVMKPKWSYMLNAQFEDHAEHEYMAFVRDNPNMEGIAWESTFSEDYGAHKTLADLFRSIGLDEREHKIKSQQAIDNARFSRQK